MSKVALKLFREPEGAKEAVTQLKAKGFKDDEIVVVANEKRGKELGADVKSIPDIDKLAEIGVPEETITYYRFNVASAGGIVVSVNAGDERAAQAQEVLRAAPICSCADRLCDLSPGFQVASRMTATDPLDAQMSGDFRKY